MRTIKLILTTLLMYLISGYSVSGQNNYSSNLKAILIVGHQEDGTQNAIAGMDKLANLFLENGVTVYKFYDKRANWDEILSVSKSCNFFVYSGHGSTMGENGNVGGICINSMVSSAELMKNLRLKENALVVFKSVCNGAGSSAGDDLDIGISEAKQRVTSYAYPFFEVGASAYYANNFGNGAYEFLNDFLSGISLKNAYLNSAKTWTDIEFEEYFSRDRAKSISIASRKGGGTATRTSYINGVKKVEQIPSPKAYDIAFVGYSGFSIRNMNQ